MSIVFINTPTKDNNMSKTTDWHNIDVIAAVKKTTGLSLNKLSIKYGLYPNTLQQALHRPYLKAEEIISQEIGVSKQTIWPSRFNSDGSRKNGRKQKHAYVLQGRV